MRYLYCCLVASSPRQALAAFSPAAFTSRQRAEINKFSFSTPTAIRSGNYLDSLSPTRDDEECIADDCLLTPQIYAASDDAEHKVEDHILDKASEAFDATDFEHEPHLSPELETVEVMLEKEMQAPYFMTPKIDTAERNQRALLETRLAMDKKAKLAAARVKERNQRALLAARFLMEKKSMKSSVAAETNELRSEWMESESLAATLGNEKTVGLASVAAIQATAETEKDTSPVDSDEPVSELASAAEMMIMRKDVALDATNKQDYNGDQKQTIAEVNQWRQDYIQEIRNYMQKKAVEKTKRRLSQKAAAKEADTTAAPTSGGSSSTEKKTTTVASFRADNSAVKRALDNGLIRRFHQRRRLIITALVMVLTRRLVLAWWGNAMRLI